MTPTETAQLFTKKAERLICTSFGASERSFGCRWSATQPTDIMIDGLDEDGLDAFLLTMRLFIQDKERISIHRFCEDVVPKLNLSADDIAAIHAIRKSLNLFLDSRLIVPWTIQPLNVHVTSHRELLDTYLYGQYAHTAARHFVIASAFNSWGICRALMTALFLQILQVIAAAVYDIAAIIHLQPTSAGAEGLNGR